MGDLISRQAAIEAFGGELYSLSLFEKIQNLPSAQPSDDYNRGWEDGRKALREEQWENGRDRLD